MASKRKTKGGTRGLYLSGEEWELLDKIAEEKMTSRNLLIRLAVRRLLGLPTPGIPPVAPPDRT